MGVLWDISWHSTIGRDTFWTPAHLLTYIGGLVPGLTCGWLALKTHFFGTAEEQGASVRLWGFRAPLGAWLVIWGSFTMLLSAPFDNWWHNAYGLDVKILSPPHTVLAVGMLAVALGVLLLMVSWQNRTAPESPLAAHLFVFVAGVLLLMGAIFLTERSLPNNQHSARFYIVSSTSYPLYLVAVARASRLRWPATITASVYMGLVLIMMWILPCFEAQPKLAPIFNPVDHMVPPAFPLLLIVPAIAIDLIVRYFRRPEMPLTFSRFLRDTALAVPLGIIFTALLLAAQWHFSKFLISPASENWFFAGSHFFPYTSNNGTWRHKFWDLQEDPVTFKRVLVAMLWAILFCRIGLGFGSWMAKVRR
jgi:multisubunit Na+/H+ antiporter MnhB subunit